MTKISIRFFDAREVRAIWDEQNAVWRFSVLDIIGVLRDVDNYQKNRNYWKYLSAKLKKAGIQLGSGTTQFKMLAPDGKKRLTNTLDQNGVLELAKQFPAKQAARFIDWFTNSDESIDGKSRSKAYALFESTLLDTIEIGTVKGLQQIHAYLFGGLYPFAGQIRTQNISKDGFHFTQSRFLAQTLQSIKDMPQTTFDEIVTKYIEMNLAHPFLEGNGRSMRIWLDLILKKVLKKCVDWSEISKSDYLNAMRKSPLDPLPIKTLLENALTDKIDDREMYIKGIDYSYYYEQDTEIDSNQSAPTSD